MFGGISASLLFDLAKKSGWMEQMEFDFPPVIYIHPSRICSVPVGHSFNNTSSISRVEHPAFENLRTSLASRGYIKIERGWYNGDIVIKPFFLNRVYFDVDDRFPCADAMKWTLEHGVYSTLPSIEYPTKPNPPHVDERQLSLI